MQAYYLIHSECLQVQKIFEKLEKKMCFKF